MLREECAESGALRGRPSTRGGSRRGRKSQTGRCGIEAGERQRPNLGARSAGKKGRRGSRAAAASTREHWLTAQTTKGTAGSARGFGTRRSAAAHPGQHKRDAPTRTLHLPRTIASATERTARVRRAPLPVSGRYFRSPIARLGRRGQRAATEPRYCDLLGLSAVARRFAGPLQSIPLAGKLVSRAEKAASGIFFACPFRGDAERAPGPFETANPAIAWTLLDPVTSETVFPSTAIDRMAPIRPKQHLAYVLLNSLNLDNQSFTGRLPIQRGMGRHEHGRSD